MSDDRTVEQHESFGMIGFSRVTSSSGQNFFGSSVRSSHYIHLTIRRAERHRHLNQYWYHGREQLINLRLSPNQFAELLTTLNVGDGVPCTLQRVAGKEMEDCPSVDQRETYEVEFKEKARSAVENAQTRLNEIRAMFEEKATIGKTDRKAAIDVLQSLINQIGNSLPFVQSQFNEAMDKTVAEAKGEVEAFVNHKIHSLGINALNTEILAALEAPLESEPLQLRSGDDDAPPQPQPKEPIWE